MSNSENYPYRIKQVKIYGRDEVIIYEKQSVDPHNRSIISEGSRIFCSHCGQCMGETVTDLIFPFGQQPFLAALKNPKCRGNIYDGFQCLVCNYIHFRGPGIGWLRLPQLWVFCHAPEFIKGQEFIKRQRFADELIKNSLK